MHMIFKIASGRSFFMKEIEESMHREIDPM